MYLTTVEHNGKTYKVYPARLDNSTFEEPELSLDDNNFIANIPIVAYNPFDLPDGNYIAYYEKNYHRKRHSRKLYVKHKDTSIIALIFTLKNNKLEGECSVYSRYHRKLIAQSYYRNGKGDSTWKIYSNYYKKNGYSTVNFKNGRVNGPAVEYNKNRVVAKTSFINGQIHGDYIGYSKNRIINKSTYNNSALVSTFKYDKKEFIYYYLNNDSASDYNIKKYNTKTKQIIFLKTHPNAFDSTFTIKKWFPNGKPKSQGLYSLKKIKYPINNYLDLLELSDVNAQDKLINYKCWHPNDEVKTQFDLSKKDSVGSIIVFDKFKNIQKIFEWHKFQNYGNAIELAVTTYGIKKAKADSTNYRKTIHVLNFNFNSEPVYSAYFKDNQYLFLKIDPIFLHLKYPDSVGLFVNNIETYKKHIYIHYNLLHSDYSFFKILNAKNNESNEVITSQMVVVNNDTSCNVKQTISTNDKKIKIIYLSKVQFKKGEFTINENYTDGLFYPKDSLNFQIFYLDIPWENKVVFRNKSFDEYQIIKGKHKYDGPKKENEPFLEIVENNSSNWLGGKELKYYYYFYSDNSFKCLHGYPTGKYNWYGINCYYFENKLDDFYKDVNRSGFYKEGLKDGLFIDEFGFLNYSKNKLDGRAIFLNSYDKQINIETTFKNDTVHGNFSRFESPHQIIEKVNFIDGLPHGEYIRGLKNKPVYISAKFDKGYFIDTAYYYFRDAGLKSKVVYSKSDSVSYTSFNSEKYFPDNLNVALDHHIINLESQERNTIDALQYDGAFYEYINNEIIEFDPNLTGNYTYYYKNGVQSQVGEVANNKRIGKWTMWDLNGALFKEIDYSDGEYTRPNSNETIHYYGKIKMYYPNGKLLLEGLILNQDFSYKCDQEMEVAFEDIYYLRFFDKEGNQSLNEKGGVVYEFHNNGIIRLKGNFLNGQRHGLWEFYNPDGKLEKRGMYEFGQKEGIWYVGDLEGMPYEDNMCSSDLSGMHKNAKSNIFLDRIKVKLYTYENDNLLESYSLYLEPLF